MDTFHGIAAPNPFGWLEHLERPEVLDWIERQNRLTSDTVERLGPGPSIRERLTDLWAYRWSGLPVRVGVRTFIIRRPSGMQQPILFWSETNSPGLETALIDPNTVAGDGSVALLEWAVDPQGTLVAYALASGGSDRQEVRIRVVKSGADLPDVILGTKSEEDLPFSNVAWAPDGRGFFYSRLPDPGTVPPSDAYRNCQVWWHAVGTSQADDTLIHEDPDDPDLNFVPIVTDDGAYLLLHAWRGLSDRHQVYVRALGEGTAFIPLLNGADARYLFLGNEGRWFYFHTNAAAPRGRLIAIDIARPHPRDWVDAVPERADPIYRAYRFGDLLVTVTVHHAHHRVVVYRPGGRGLRISLPDQGTVSDVAIDAETGHLMVQFESFLRPRETLRFAIETGELVGDEAIPPPVDRSAFATHERFATAPDRTAIPVTIIGRADTLGREISPLVLYGYGGFNVSTTPLFDPWLIAWIERGGVYAIASPRGGSEYGEAWHEAGRRGTKETVFADFEAVAEWLIASRYTSAERLAIRGESNGGLLVAASMLRRPELFGAVVCSLPVTDMLRFPRFTIGHYWTHEYGDPDADPADFETLLRYSPLENVRAGADYPAILVTTGDGDDRVVPAHAMKLVATLQRAAPKIAAPRLLRLQHGSGHGLGKPVSGIVELDLDIDAFLVGTIGRDLAR